LKKSVVNAKIIISEVYMFDKKKELKKLPNKPGVYIMRDKDNNILYIGKAVILKNRVRQYFMKNNKTERIKKMVSLIDHFEYIVTDNEAEALLLECNLIKKHRPKFNVLLKDDKTYPYIKIDIKSEFPNVFTTRKILNDGAKYFGPYPNSGAAKEMVRFIKEKYKIRQCKAFKSNQRACLNYHIKRCLAPCINNISREEYMRQIDEVIMLLEGKTSNILKKLDSEMKIASNNLEFEKAAYIRDRKMAIQSISEKQKMSNLSENNIDVIGLYKNELKICIEIFFVRGSKMIGREHYIIDNNINALDDEIISSFIKQYYMNKDELPSKIMIKEEFEDKELIEKWLSKKANRKVEIKTPQKGEKLKFVEMAEKNAKITLDNQYKDKFNVLKELKNKLCLSKIPNKIECFDISNISGTNIVSGMCVAINGEINRKLSRRFKIKTVFDQDDPKCMYETISRRIKHSLDNQNGGFGTLPDVIFVDGGITQILAAKNAVDEFKLNIPIFGMVKNDKHKTRALINDRKEEILISEQTLNFITNLQDEVHNVAIEYHKKLRDKSMTQSKLDEINGIGNAKKLKLLKEFGTVDNISKLSIEELAKVSGIGDNLAKKILNYLNEK